MTGSGGRWDAVFVDRDGTLNVGAGPGAYITSPESLVLAPGAATAVARLNAADCRVILVTNQRGVALGMLTEATLEAIHGRLRSLLADAGAHLDGIYACLHDEGVCDCRKPRDGLLRRAFQDHPLLRPAHCAIVGDSSSDTEAGLALGLTRVRLDPRLDEPADLHADFTVPDLAAAVEMLLAGPDTVESGHG